MRTITLYVRNDEEFKIKSNNMVWMGRVQLLIKCSKQWKREILRSRSALQDNIKLTFEAEPGLNIKEFSPDHK
jgi:hypothetical protein